MGTFSTWNLIVIVTHYPAARLSRGLASCITMASQLSGPNIEEEYYWSTTLDKDNKEYTWAVQEDGNVDSEDEESDPPCKPNHRLLIKNALLDPEATKDEVTVLEIETKGYKEQKVIAPFLAMKGGAELQRYVDLLLPDSAKIRIKRGNGPVTLVGSHCVDFYDYRNMGYAGEDDNDDEESEKDEDEVEELPKKSPTKEAKKKSPAKEAKKKSPEKEAAKKSPFKEAEAKEPSSGKPTTPKEGKKRKASSEQSPASGDGKKKRKGSGDK